MDWGVGEKTSLIWLKKKKKGLEISPLFAPLILKDEGDVMYCDYIDYESLKNRENNNQGRIDCGLEVQPIDFVWTPEKALKDCTNVKFDYIVSSHVLEHVPNFIGYIHEMKSVLKDDGIIAFVIPCSKGGGEYYRGLSSVGQLLEAFILNYKKPTPSMIYDGHRQAFLFENINYEDVAYNSSKIQWSHSKNDSKNVSIYSMDNYVDAHCWAFTSESLVNRFKELKEIGCFDFDILEIKASQPATNTGHEAEIYVSLTPNKKNNSTLIHEQSKTKSLLNIEKPTETMTDKITELEKAVEHGAKAFYEAVDAQNLLKKEKVDLEKQISKLKGMR